MNINELTTGCPKCKYGHYGAYPSKYECYEMKYNKETDMIEVICNNCKYEFLVHPFTQ